MHGAGGHALQQDSMHGAGGDALQLTLRSDAVPVCIAMRTRSPLKMVVPVASRTSCSYDMASGPCDNTV